MQIKISYIEKEKEDNFLNASNIEYNNVEELLFISNSIEVKLNFDKEKWDKAKNTFPSTINNTFIIVKVNDMFKITGFSAKSSMVFNAKEKNVEIVVIGPMYSIDDVKKYIANNKNKTLRRLDNDFISVEDFLAREKDKEMQIAYKSIKRLGGIYGEK